MHRHDKGKPVEKRGRKAMGLTSDHSIKIARGESPPERLDFSIVYIIYIIGLFLKEKVEWLNLDHLLHVLLPSFIRVKFTKLEIIIKNNYLFK